MQTSPGQGEELHAQGRVSLMPLAASHVDSNSTHSQPEHHRMTPSLVRQIVVPITGLKKGKANFQMTFQRKKETRGAD